MLRYVFDPDAIRYAMRRARYGTVRAFAAAAEVDASVVYHMLNDGNGCTASTLLQLADALDVDPHDLMIEVED